MQLLYGYARNRLTHRSNTKQPPLQSERAYSVRGDAPAKGNFVRLHRLGLRTVSHPGSRTMMGRSTPRTARSDHFTDARS